MTTNIFVVVEVDRELGCIRNMETFGNPFSAAEAIDRLSWAGQISEIVRSGAMRVGDAAGMVSPDHKTRLEVGISVVEGSLPS